MNREIAIAPTSSRARELDITDVSSYQGRRWYRVHGSYVLGVVGVPFDDVLNVRAAPGGDQRIVARLDPLADDVVATGAARQLAQSIWHEVTAEGVIGWVNLKG